MVCNFILDFHFLTLPKTYGFYVTLQCTITVEMYLSIRLSLSEPAVYVMLHPEHRKLPESTKTKKKQTFVACLNTELCKLRVCRAENKHMSKSSSLVCPFSSAIQ